MARRVDLPEVARPRANIRPGIDDQRGAATVDNHLIAFPQHVVMVIGLDVTFLVGKHLAQHIEVAAAGPYLDMLIARRGDRSGFAECDPLLQTGNGEGKSAIADTVQYIEK